MNIHTASFSMQQMLWFNTLKGQEQEKKIYIFIIAHVNHELFILKHKINPKFVFLPG